MFVKKTKRSYFYESIYLNWVLILEKIINEHYENK